jgi:hypothetical protein
MQASQAKEIRENLTVITTERFSLFHLLFKKQHEFHLPSPFDAWNYLTSVATERNVLLIDVPVSCFQFLYELAFGQISIT